VWTNEALRKKVERQVGHMIELRDSKIDHHEAG